MTNSPCSRSLHYFLYLFIFDKSLKRIFNSLRLCVYFKVPFLWESFLTMAAIIRLLPSVSPVCVYQDFLSCKNFVTMVIHIRFLPIVSPYMYSKFPKTMQCFIQNHLQLCHNSYTYVASPLCSLMWCLKSLFPRKTHHNGCIDMASP